jgi:hypothetical protein
MKHKLKHSWGRLINTVPMVWLLGGLETGAAAVPTYYVNAANPNPQSPYTSWETAARNIQDAVDAAVAGGEVVVTNGFYATGGRAASSGKLVNRVAVEKPVTLRSVNGPEVTTIAGGKASSGDNGAGAIRCVFLGEGTMLSGFTLSGGATLDSGDVDLDQSAGGAWCASTKVTITNCLFLNNSAAFDGGGALRGTLYNCTLTSNTAWDGGATGESVLHYCTLTGNKAGLYGGGAFGGVLHNCTVTGNSATYGGGVANSLNYDSQIILYSCVLAGNSAQRGGGATSSSAACKLYNCTVTGNSASEYGGGVANEFIGCCGPFLANCIVCFNTPENYQDCTFEYSCPARSRPAPATSTSIRNWPAKAIFPRSLPASVQAIQRARRK